MRSLLLALLLATTAVHAQAPEGALLMERNLATQLPAGTPDAAERSALIQRLQQDQGMLQAQGRAHALLITKLGEDLRASEAERTRMLMLAAAIGSVLAILLAGIGVALLRQKIAERKKRPGAWYRPAPLPLLTTTASRAGAARAGLTGDAALSPLDWTDEQAAATQPLVREFGRGRAGAPRAVSG